MLFYFDHFMEIWLLPPGNSLLLFLVGFLLWRRWPILGKSLITTSFILLWVLSTPYVAQHLIDKLQYQSSTFKLNKLAPDKSAAIVVLEAGLNLQTPEYNSKPTVSDGTLSRLRYAAFLHKKMGVPILVSGSDPTHASINQADHMANALKEYFDVPTQWKESNGFNTAQEGILSVEILKKAGITKIYLVTHAFHMPRSLYAFQHKGIEIIPAPTGYITFDFPLGKISFFLPTIDALNESSTALREYIGYLWYRLHYRF